MKSSNLIGGNLMDRITQSLVKEFRDNYDYKHLPEDELFENFVNYIVVTKEFGAGFDIDAISTGRGGDLGIDGFAFIINGRLVLSLDDVDEICSPASNLSASLIFIQSKRSAKFDSAEINNLFFGIGDFLSEKPRLTMNNEIASMHDIWNSLLEKYSAKLIAKPNVKIYYVTTGKWTEDSNLLATIEVGKESILGQELFSSVHFYPIDGNAIHKLYRSTKHRLEVQIIFEEKVTLPDINGVQESYFGFLPFKEFKKLIYSEEDNQIRNVFYDNVRDYAGKNPVNDSIRRTVTDGMSDQFVVLNNGVTIVASGLSSIANKFTIRDYQIVNGCQTSHVLISALENSNIELVRVPIRLIVTEDESLRDRITLATNSQTAVKAEQLEAQTDFQKNLEQYFRASIKHRTLYYERRANQYNLQSEVKKTQIVSIGDQIKTFASMFLDSPHAVTGYFGTVMKRHSGKIFQEGHKPDAYFTSSYAFYRLNYLIRNGSLDRSFRKPKYHLLMIFRMITEPFEMPHMNSKKMEKYCESINSLLDNEEASKAIFTACEKIFRDSGIDLSVKQFKSESETRVIKDFLISKKEKYIKIEYDGSTGRFVRYHMDLEGLGNW
ncbi:AIPR family protein [Deinococcus lacus]|uniref:AIPR family protein n=1 Tax=Deinococcus lacus TaxID=392561 RepID=A0ABW1YCH6_9DEIO